MRARFLLPLLFISLLTLPVWAQDQNPQEIDPHNGAVTVQPDTQENMQNVPIDEETGTVDWSKYSNLPPGPGANFGFLTTLYPPEPAALADIPAQPLDTAWFPVIPFAFGYTPPADPRVSTQGWWYLEDTTGTLARRDMNITAGGSTWFCSTWFLGGTNVFHIEEGWQSGYFAETNYLPDEYSGAGIDYFLRSVWFHGVLGGQRMQDLLTYCNAQHIGRDLMRGGHDRLAIFQIPASETDRQNGRGSLLVWLTIGDWRLVRTRLHAVYATEVTEFRNVSPEVQNDPQVFYSDFLSQDLFVTIDQYLLTHEGPFWGPGTDQPPFNPAEAGLIPVEPSETESGQSSGESSDSSGTGASGDSQG